MRHEKSRRLGRRCATTAVLAVATVVTAAGAVENGEAAKLAADAVRAQGHPCAEPVSAEPQPTADRPDEQTWLLVCNDARYRVRFRGDVAPEVERLE